MACKRRIMTFKMHCLRSGGVSVAGVIPIDRLTDVRAPAEVIAQRIPRPVLEATYSLQLPRPRNGANT